MYAHIIRTCTGHVSIVYIWLWLVSRNKIPSLSRIPGGLLAAFARRPDVLCAGTQGSNRRNGQERRRAAGEMV